jgi:hypothetical protein
MLGLFQQAVVVQLLPADHSVEVDMLLVLGVLLFLLTLYRTTQPLFKQRHHNL